MRKMKNKGRKFKKQQKKIDLLGLYYKVSYDPLTRYDGRIQPRLMPYSKRKHLGRINHESIVVLRRREPLPVDSLQGYPDRFRYVNLRKAMFRGPKFQIYVIGNDQSVL